ncbi:DFM1 DER1-like family member protein 1 [Candida maltosa Xu316]
MANNTIVDNILAIPPVTRFFTLASVIACLGITTLGVFPQLFCNYFTLKLDFIQTYQAIKYKGYAEIFQTTSWTIIKFYKFLTSMIVPSGIMSPSKYTALMDIYFFYTFSNHLESYGGKFNGNFPDYLWYIILCGTFVQIASLFYNGVINDLPVFPHSCMLACVTYTWSRCNKNARINLMGMVPIKAYYLPLGNLLIELIIRGPSGLVDTAIGIICGYLYLCIQSNTLPIYNLLNGAYGESKTRSNDDARKVGVSSYVDYNRNFGGNTADFIGDSIYDRGYLKAPKFLYKFLGIRTNTSVRTTAFTHQKKEKSGNGTGYSWFGEESAFRGKGNRLGG